jgi:predicted ATPase
MLTKLTASHYKSLEAISIDFSTINVIVGLNGAGKSNIIDVVSLFADVVHGDLDSAIMKRHGIESIRQWAKFRPYDISLEVEFTTRTGGGKYGFSLKSGRGDYRVSEEHGEWVGADPFNSSSAGPIRSTFRRGKEGVVEFDIQAKLPGSSAPYKAKSIPISSSELYLTTLNTAGFTVEGVVFGGIAKELGNLVSYSIYPNTLRQPRVVSKEERLVADGSNLPSIIRKMTGSNRSRKDSIVEAISSLLPHIDGIIVRSAGGYYVPVLEGRGANDEAHQYNLSQVSDGTLRMLGLLTALYQPDRPRMIAIEEPEQMIHPGALPVLAEAMEEYVLSGGAEQHQLFITTHSPNLLDLFKPEHIIWTSYQNGVTNAGRVDDRQVKIIKSRLFTVGEVFTTEGFGPV